MILKALYKKRAFKILLLEDRLLIYSVIFGVQRIYLYMR